MGRKLPEGWESGLKLEENLVDLLKKDRTYGDEIKGKKGKIPILNQSENGFYGYHNNEPSFNGSKENGYLTFANHTGAIRYVERDFSTIQNIFVMQGKNINNKEKINTKAIYYLLQYRKYKENIGEYAGHFPKFRDNFTYTFPINNITEQQKIVSYLDKQFTFIDNMEKEVNEYEKKLNELRFGIIENEYKNQKKDKKIIDFFDTKYGLNESTKGLQGNIGVFKMGDITTEGRIEYKNLDYISNETFNKEYLLKKGDILFNRTNSKELVGKTALFDLDGDYTYVSYLVRLRIKKGKEELVFPKFISYFLNSKEMKDFFYKNSQDAVKQSNFNATKLGEVLIPLPNLNTQKQIAYKLDKQFEIINSTRIEIKKQQENLKQLRKAILNDIFGGFEE